MLSDDLFEFSQSAWRVSYIAFGVSILAALATVPFLVIGWAVALFDNIPRDVFERDTRRMKIWEALVYEFAPPFVAAAALVAAPIAFAVTAVSILFGALTRVGEVLIGARRRENRRIQESLEQLRVREDAEARQRLEAVQMRDNLNQRRASAALPLPPQLQRAEDLALIQSIRAARANYLRAEPRQRQERLANLRRLYATYLEVFSYHPLADIDETLRQAHTSDADSSNAAFYMKHQQAYNQLFNARNLSRAKHVLDKPLTDTELTLLRSRICIGPEDKGPQLEEKKRNQLIFNAALEDCVFLDTMRTPVRVNGRTYDLLSLKDQRNTPLDRQPFEQKDIIPNNTLGRAILYLKRSFAGNNSQDPVPQYDLVLRAKAEIIPPNTHAPCMTSAEVANFGSYYEKLVPYQKKLVDIMCKDPLTGVIFQDPVYLADGYTYERSTLLAILQEKTAARQKAYCPYEPNISFTLNDIKTCFRTRDVLEQINKEIAKMKKQEEQKPSPTPTSFSISTSIIHQALQIAPAPQASHAEIKVMSTSVNDDAYATEQGKRIQDIYQSKDTVAAPLMRPLLSAEEVKKLEAHLDGKSSAIVTLFRTACFDEDGLMRTPFRHPNGQTRDLKTWSDAFAHYPETSARKKDLLPNNTLLEGYQQLLDLIDQKPPVKKEVKEHETLSGLKNKAPAKLLLTFSEFQKMQDYYKKLSAEDKLLFDIMCRDPLTGKIFQDPVFLPDGRTYESTTVNELLKNSTKGAATIPGTQVGFTQKDVKPCAKTKEILLAMKKRILQSQNPNAAGQSRVAPRYP